MLTHFYLPFLHRKQVSRGIETWVAAWRYKPLDIVGAQHWTDFGGVRHSLNCSHRHEVETVVNSHLVNALRLILK